MNVEQVLDQAFLALDEHHLDEARAAFDVLEKEQRLTAQQTFRLAIAHGCFGVLQSDWKRAAQHFQEAYHLGLRREDRSMECEALRCMASLAFQSGHPRQALSLYRAELSLWTSRMDTYFRSLSRNYKAQAEVLLTMGETDEARIYGRHALTFAATAQDLRTEAEAREFMAELERREGKIKEAKRQLRSALERYRQLGLIEADQRVSAALKDL